MKKVFTLLITGASMMLIANAQPRRPMTQIGKSPHRQIQLSRYDPGRHGRPPAHLEAQPFVVLENNADKAIVAVVALWTWTSNGRERKQVLLSDCYMFADSLAAGMVKPKAAAFVALHDVTPVGRPPSTGQGSFAMTTGSGAAAEADDYTVTIDAVMFADGEVAGPDTTNLAAEIPARKAAAVRIARAVRLSTINAKSIKENIDELMPVLGDPDTLTPAMVLEFNYCQQFAAEVYQKQNDEKFDAYVRWLENLPVPPQTYKKQANEER